MFIPVVFIQAKNAVNIPNSFIKELFFHFVNDVITYGCLYGFL